MLSFNHDWETSIFRRALEETGDVEALQAFDEEQEMLKVKAEKEIQEMKDKGEIKDDIS